MTDCTVWWAEPIIDGEAAPAALALLDAAERQRHEAYRMAADRARFRTGRVLAKTVAAHRLGIAVDAVTFDATCDDCGKPHGPVRIPGAALALSISHAGDRVGVAVTDGAPVGLDVEATGRGAEHSLLDYALNEAEQAGLPAPGTAERAEAFYAFWTRKEAVMKATGRGLRIALRDLTLSPADQPARLLASTEEALSPETTRMADLDPGPGYRAAVAVLTGADAGEIDVTERWWSPEAVAGGH
ncbi:4'-phosphopantetheinyl transferase family protein [Saccharomonospora saliphila]|uniref:4'-phosphopantetheinyl transferase family protein n=1 Tax=Saccharomonospora saliphila TaxID=369829 RepID=UPI00036838F8|nr:4'-phosphopantetheinyl transferase superfamily protein [Saccharomonospora saliphila]